MAQKLLKRKPRKIEPSRARSPAAPQPTVGRRVPTPPQDGVVLVGTYKEGQLAWIKRHGIYNYPVKDGDEFDEKAFASIKELWLYADAKGTRHVFETEFIGIKTRAELISEYGYPDGNVLAAKNAKSAKIDRARPPSAPHGSRYYVFKTKYLDYGPRLDDPLVIARTADFGGRSAKVKKAIEQFKADGEFAPLEHYLPSDLAHVPRSRLRVCEAAVQMRFFSILYPAKPVHAQVAGSRDLNVISMFSGAMGLDNGIEKAGMHIRLCVEIQHAMAETIRANRPNIPLIEDDVRNYSGADLRAVAGLKKNDEVFLVCGGPPCQAFSTAGKRLGFDDDRGNVFLKYIDLIGEIRPRYFLLENVRGLLSASYVPPLQENDADKSEKPIKGSALLYALEKIKQIGYSATFTLYDSANYGVPQRRERVIILGSRDGYKIPLIPPTHSETARNGLKKWTTFRNAIKGLKSCTAAPIPEKRLKYFRLLGPGECWRNLPEELKKEAMGKSYDLPGGKTGFYRRLAWDDPSPTLVTCPTMPATDLMHPIEDRALSIEEYARVQMFPDDWRFMGSTSDIYKQIGNAVPVGMGYAAAKHLLWFDALTDLQKSQVQLVDPEATYSRYKGTDFVYFDQLREKQEKGTAK